MYSSYQIGSVSFEESSKWLAKGKEIEQENLARVRKPLASFLGKLGEVDASKMMQEWFAEFSPDVFISHSRADKDFALMLTGWLHGEFGLSSFVDSCAWGHASDLLRQLDNAYCKTGESTFSYSRSTITASHVHLMLATALTQMIDRSECVFFLSTKNSLKPISVERMAQSEDEQFTQSPWLFHELSMLRLVRRREKDAHRPGKVKKADFSEARANVPTFNYPVILDDLLSLDADDLNRWRTSWSSPHGFNDHALDHLYRAKPTGLTSILE